MGGAEETLTSPRNFFTITSTEQETLLKPQGIPNTFGVFPCQESEVIPRAAQMLSGAFTSRSCSVPEPSEIQTLHIFPATKGRRAWIRHGDFLLLHHLALTKGKGCCSPWDFQQGSAATWCSQNVILPLEVLSIALALP